MRINEPNENMRKMLRTITVTGLVILACLITTISFQYYTVRQYNYALDEIAVAVQDAKQITYYALRYQLVNLAQESDDNPAINYDEMKDSLKTGLDFILKKLEDNDAANKADRTGLLRMQLKNDVNRLYGQSDDIINEDDFSMDVLSSIDTQSTLLISYLDNIQDDMMKRLAVLQAMSYVLYLIMIATSVMSLAIGVASANRHRRDYEIEKEYENYTDGLTGLLNQKYATTMLPREVMYDKTGYLLMLDMDNFKKVNDTFGHAAGDRALTTFAEVLRNTTRENDIPCRLGGDEFLVYARAIKNDAEAKSFAKRIQSKTVSAFAGTELSIVTISCGITPVVGGATFDILKKRADKALYHVKEHEKGTYYLLRSRETYGSNRNP